MRKEKNLYDLHLEWLDKGKIDSFGLCSSVPKEYAESLKLLKATEEDMDTLALEKKPQIYWAYGEHYEMFSTEIRCRYTELRQTIVLFICAMNNEIP